MRHWRIVEVIDGTEADLTSTELVAIANALVAQSKRQDERDVYWRARQKIQGVARVASNDYE